MKKQEITLKNTKAEILEALNEALEREKDLQKVKYEPEKEEKQRKQEKAIEETRENVEQKIFSDELNSKFENLEIAIKAEEEKLKELYGIEKELSNLVVVVNAGKDYIAKLEEEKQEKEKEINSKIQELEEEYDTKKEELEKEYELKAKNLKIEREREQEEYNYKIKRERQIDNNNWQDEKQKREKELEEKETKTMELLEEVEDKKEHLEELEKKVEEIPELLKSEYERGAKEKEEEIKKENKFTTELLKKDYQNTIDRQKDKIDSLVEELNKSNEEKKAIQEKLDQAYTQIKDMATKTVEATGGVKILGNNNSDTSK